jgi:Exostosin family
MRIHFARLGGTIDAPVDRLEHLASLDHRRVHRVASDPDDADVIVFSQCHMLLGDWRLTAIARKARTLSDPRRVMVFDERDHPWCRFPGLYVSMPAKHFNYRYQRPWAYFPRIVPIRSLNTPDLLFSFTGSMTHKCRLRLVDLRGDDAIVEAVSGFTFYDPSSRDFQARQERFTEILGRSRFVLCPRGRGTSSIRLFEALSIGRVPVVISDEWIPPRGPDWSRFSLRWPEGRVSGLREFIRAHDDMWDEMSVAAAEAYAEFFAPDVWFHRFAELCDELRRESGSGFPTGGIRRAAYFGSGARAGRARARAWCGRVRPQRRELKCLGSST